jgi:hypothetical protein
MLESGDKHMKKAMLISTEESHSYHYIVLYMLVSKVKGTGKNT